MDSDVKIARERFDACWSAMNENRNRMLEDLRFSNPANPEQWDKEAVRARGDRPMLVFDRSNQYISQVVNAARQNKPSMRVRPVSDDASAKAATALNGLLFHIQDVSRADIAYDTALESAARVGLGWIRILPEVIDEATNEQEIRIKRVTRFDSVVLDDGWTEPDGSDAMDGFFISELSEAAFLKKYKGAKILSFDEGGWFRDKTVRVAEYFKVEERLENYLTVQDPQNPGNQLDLTEKEYWTLSKAISTNGPIPYIKQWTETVREVRWTKMSGAEVLEETDFPASHVPLIPVIGNEMWVDDRRYLCGMVRKGMDAQKAYNYARTLEIELTSMQPKVPMMVAGEAVEGFEGDWENLNDSDAAYVRYNARDDDGNALPVPQRVASAQFPAAFAQLTQMANDDLQAAFGMYKSNLGAPSNAISGRAKMQDQREGDTANFHFLDNMNRSARHLGSIAVEMIPQIYNTQRVARILAPDGTPSQIVIDPNAPQSWQQQPNGKIVINPSIGDYDVMVSQGPAYATLRQEAAEQMAALFQANPQTFALLGPLWMKSQDWPFAEEAAAILKAAQPPQIQAISQSSDPEVAAAQAQVKQLSGQLQQVTQAAQAMHAQLQQKEDDARRKQDYDSQKLAIEKYSAITARLTTLVPADPQLAVALYRQTLAEVFTQPDPLMNDGPNNPAPPPPMPVMPQGMPMQQPQGPQGPFSLPAQGPVQVQ